MSSKYMSNVKCKCTVCGEILELDEKLDAYICPACKNPFVVEKAIERYRNEEENEEETIKYDSNLVIQKGILIQYKGDMEVVDIPNIVTIIGESAFINNNSLKDVIIPDSVKRISDTAFKNCTSLTEINIPGSCESVGDNVFEDCINIEKVTLGEGVVSIGDAIFRNCTKLAHIDLPESLNYIGYYAFSGCKNLNNVQLKSGAKIEDGAFDECTKLTKDSKMDIRKHKRGCYIATCVYGSYSCPEVWTLRRYRDEYLGKSFFGRLFIKTYYALSPRIVKMFGKTNWFKSFWRRKLDRMVYKLNSNGYDNTPYKDKDWN